MAPVVAPAGIDTCTCVLLITRTDTPCAFPTHASFSPVNPLPLMVTTVPTPPDIGENVLMVGCGGEPGAGVGVGVGAGALPEVTLNGVAVNAAYFRLKMPIEPPVAPAGIVTCTCLSLSTRYAAPRVCPTQALLMPVKPVPLMVTTVPIGPELGEKPLIFCCTSGPGEGVGLGVGVGVGDGEAEPHSFFNRFILSGRTCRLLSSTPPVSPLLGVYDQ